MNTSTGYRFVCFLLGWYCAGILTLSAIFLAGRIGPFWPWGSLLLLAGGLLMARAVAQLFKASAAGLTLLRASTATIVVFILAMVRDGSQKLTATDAVLILLGVFVVSLLYWALEVYLRDEMRTVISQQNASTQGR